MRRIIFITVLFAALAQPTTAHAQEAIVVADCDQVTFTAPEDSRVIFSLDSSPPGEVDDGNTVTQQFFPLGVNAAMQTIVMYSHHWSAAVIEHGVQTAFQAGDVTGCAITHISTAVEPEIIPTLPPHSEVLVTFEPDFSVWAHVALAPPW